MFFTKVILGVETHRHQRHGPHLSRGRSFERFCRCRADSKGVLNGRGRHVEKKDDFQENGLKRGHCKCNFLLFLDIVLSPLVNEALQAFAGCPKHRTASAFPSQKVTGKTPAMRQRAKELGGLEMTPRSSRRMNLGTTFSGN